MNEGLEYLGRARMQGLLLLVVVLFAGVLAGAAGDRLLSQSEGPPRRGPPRHGPPHGPPRGPGQGLPEVLDRLDLSDAQRNAIDSLLRAYRPRSEAILRTVYPRLRAQSDSLRAEVRAVLTKGQQRTFDREMVRRPRGDFEPPPFPPPHRGPGGGPPPGGLGFGPGGPPEGAGPPPPPGGPGGPPPPDWPPPPPPPPGGPP